MYDIPQASRLIRTNVFPIMLLTAGVLVWCALEFIGKFIPVFAILGKVFRCLAGACTGKKRVRTVMRPGAKIRSRYAGKLETLPEIYLVFFLLLHCILFSGKVSVATNTRQNERVLLYYLRICKSARHIAGSILQDVRKVVIYMAGACSMHFVLFMPFKQGERRERRRMPMMQATRVAHPTLCLNQSVGLI